MKRPLVLKHRDHVEWSSHRYIVPSMCEIFKKCGFDSRLYGDRPISPREAREISENATCLILVPPLDRALKFVRQLRLKFTVNTPVVLTETSHMVARGSLFFDFAKILNSNDSIVACASSGRALLSEGLSQHKRIFQIPLPVLKTEMNPLDNAERTAFRKQIGLKKNEKLIIFAGRLTPQKNIHGLLDAFSIALREQPRSKLFILGGFDDECSPTDILTTSASYRNFLKKRVKELGLSRHVIFKGNIGRKELRNYFASADLHASLTVFYREDFGFAVCEGLACGVPTLLTEWGGGLDVTRGRGARGISVHITDEGPLADVAEAGQLMTDMLSPGENLTWRRRASVYYSKYLSEQKLIAQWKDLAAGYERKLPRARPFRLGKKVLFANFETAMRGPIKPTDPMFSSSSHPYYRWVTDAYLGKS